MVRRVIWTRKALADLRGIKDYIAADSPYYAQLQIERIRSAIAHAGRYPEIGRSLPEFPEEPWREVLTGNYRVIYRVEPEGGPILVLAVIHGRQLLWESMVQPR